LYGSWLDTELDLKTKHYLLNGISQIRDAPDIRPDTGFDLPDIIPDIRLIGRIIQKFLKAKNEQVKFQKGTFSYTFFALYIYYLRKHLNFQLKIRPDIRYLASPDIPPDIRYPAFRLAGYPANSVPGVSLFQIDFF
jgi:hypothetical protein